jgi:hypothetical protein
MVMISKQVKQEWPQFKKWLYSEFVDVPRKQRVWDAFLLWSGLGKADGEIAVGIGSLPQIVITQLKGALGRYKPSEKKKIYLDTDVVKYLEQNPSNQYAKKLVESTILHELCHWAESVGVRPKNKDGYGKGKVERGRHFEVDAYGGNVTLQAGQVITEKYEQK